MNTTNRTCPHCGTRISSANWRVNGIDLRQWPHKPPTNIYLCRDCARTHPFLTLRQNQYQDLPLLADLDAE